MAICLHNISVASCLQTPVGIANVLSKGAQHAATTYDVLRMHEVPLGKMDSLGALRVGG